MAEGGLFFLLPLRWFNHLDPQIVKKDWTEAEDQKIIELHKTYGNKWAEIALHLTGRYVPPLPLPLPLSLPSLVLFLFFFFFSSSFLLGPTTPSRTTGIPR